MSARSKVVQKKVKSKPASPSRLIDQRIAELRDWRGKTLARMRKLILEADPGIIEEWKWDVPVWSRFRILCTGEVYKSAVKLTFARGAKIPDPRGLFNASLEGNTRRAIDIREGETIDARAFKALIKAAVAEAKGPGKASDVVLLSGGNPQVAKGEGEAPVKAYIAALPGWKRDAMERLDAIIVRTFPDVRKAVKWNSPLYGLEGKGWFLGVHAFTRYLKVNFFKGASLKPLPPGPSKDKDTRYLDVHEDDGIDEVQFAHWVRQAAKLPGFLAPETDGPRGARRKR
jgi:hypothetical protein